MKRKTEMSVVRKNEGLHKTRGSFKTVISFVIAGATILVQPGMPLMAAEAQAGASAEESPALVLTEASWRKDIRKARTSRALRVGFGLPMAALGFGVSTALSRADKRQNTQLTSLGKTVRSGSLVVGGLGAILTISGLAKGSEIQRLEKLGQEKGFTLAFDGRPDQMGFQYVRRF